MTKTEKYLSLETLFNYVDGKLPPEDMLFVKKSIESSESDQLIVKGISAFLQDHGNDGEKLNEFVSTDKSQMIDILDRFFD